MHGLIIGAWMDIRVHLRDKVRVGDWKSTREHWGKEETNIICIHG